MARGYPARAGGLWLWRTLLRSGFQAVVVPSGFRTRVQPQRWMGHYLVMFTNPLPSPDGMAPDEFPGRKAFQRLTDAVAKCIGSDPEGPEAFRTAQLIWQQLHGIVSLRISRPGFPWPPLAQTVTEAVDRLLAGAASC